MFNQYRQNFIKAFALLAIINAVFVGTVVHAYVPQWTDYRTNNFTGGTSSVLKNADYWQVTLSGVTNGGVIIGDPFYKLPIQVTNIAPWLVRYEVLSNTNCIMRIVYANSTNGVTGSNVNTLAPTTATTTSMTFTSPSVQAGINGIAIYRNAGTADCVVRIYSIIATDGTLLFSPFQNLDVYSGTLSITNTTATTSGDTTVNVLQPETEEMLNFVMLLLTYVIPLVLFIYLTKKFYVRE